MACETFYGPDSVPFAFVLVAKRISTRFFTNSKTAAQNPQPGTVVDSVVTDPTKYLKNIYCVTIALIC